MVAGHLIVATVLADHHAGYKSEHFHQIHDAKITNHVAGDNGCGARYFKLRLAQSGRCQHLRDLRLLAFLGQ